MMMGAGVAEWLSKKTQGRVQKDENGVPLMTAETVRCLCLQHDGYECPEINDKLYLHFQGFRKIGGLDEYVGLKCLYLESNGISQVSGLAHLTELKCLYLQQNVIKSIAAPALQGLSSLVTLDISSNLLESLEGVSALPALQTLNAAKNNLGGAAALEDLAGCMNLASLDIRGNQIDNNEENKVLEALASVPKLSAIYLLGNPCVKTIKHYRKTMIARFPLLTYLDEAPVEEKDRVFAQAFASGGREAETEAREAWKASEKDKVQSHIHSWKEFKREARARREAEIKQAEADGKPFPEARRYVSYHVADDAEVDHREKQMRKLAVAEAEAERNSILGHGIQMMGLDFARETAQRNGATFSSPSQELQDKESSSAGLVAAPADEERTDPESADTSKSQLVEDSLRQHKQLEEQEGGEENGVVKVDKMPEIEMMTRIKAHAPLPPKQVSESQETAHPSQPTKVEDIDAAALIQAVRDAKFDFEVAARAMSAMLEREISSEDCRLLFAEARKAKTKKASPPSPPSPSTTKPEPSIQKVVLSLPADHQGELASVSGVPMPKIGLTAPSELPSMEDDHEEEEEADGPGEAAGRQREKCATGRGGPNHRGERDTLCQASEPC
ncbi:Dynein axonemal assembly factor 1 (Leucine-rich repeat-containing protein 50) [Durusdinium trenchii]|uniref:Dynein axonemal assembly factor 1 (Leucine-rich repeat-containing protein 50) n=1 Tax=Durusdinium trenchii TaxID=1381693 RepID=A0ABP0QU73_9DINO